MREDAFISWMRSQGTMGVRPMCDAVSRCKRICKGLNIDLDAEYAKDGGRSVIARLEYSAQDARAGKEIPGGLDFAPGVNLKNGMASLKSAAKKYFAFCDDTK